MITCIRHMHWGWHALMLSLDSLFFYLFCCGFFPLFWNSRIPNTNVGQHSILAVKPLRKIWCKNITVSALRNIEFTSSWLHGGFCELAAILNGRKKQDTISCNCSKYSSSASTIRNTKLCERRKNWVLF